MPHEPSKPTLRRKLILVGLLLLAAWITFFDSHSLVKRVRWHHEVNTLTAENKRLRLEADQLTARLREGLSDEVVEQIAREQYGMRRAGETVYRVKQD